jgi:hypothetical protein
LIYLKPEIQKKLLSQFSHSLNHGGYLFLGKADTSIDRKSVFEPVLSKHFNAAVVLVNERGVIAHFYGPTNKYLEHLSGTATLSLFEMVERHSFKFRMAVEKAFRENRTVTLASLDFAREGSESQVDITVSPCEPQLGTKLVAVIFQAAVAPRRGDPTKPGVRQNIPSDTGDEIVKRLELEIKSLKDDLAAGNDQFQASHEELSAANQDSSDQ